MGKRNGTVGRVVTEVELKATRNADAAAARAAVAEREAEATETTKRNDRAYKQAQKDCQGPWSEHSQATQAARDQVAAAQKEFNTAYRGMLQAELDVRLTVIDMNYYRRIQDAVQDGVGVTVSFASLWASGGTASFLYAVLEGANNLSRPGPPTSTYLPTYTDATISASEGAAGALGSKAAEGALAYGSLGKDALEFWAPAELFPLGQGFMAQSATVEQVESLRSLAAKVPESAWGPTNADIDTKLAKWQDTIKKKDAAEAKLNKKKQEESAANMNYSGARACVNQKENEYLGIK